MRQIFRRQFQIPPTDFFAADLQQIALAWARGCVWLLFDKVRHVWRGTAAKVESASSCKNRKTAKQKTHEKRAKSGKGYQINHHRKKRAKKCQKSQHNGKQKRNKRTQCHTSRKNDHKKSEKKSGKP